MKGSPSLGFWIPGFCASGTWFLDYNSRIQDSLEYVLYFQNQGIRIQQQILMDSGFSQVKIFRIS